MKCETCTGKRGILKFLMVDMNLAYFNYLSISKFPSFLKKKIIISPCCHEIGGKSSIHLKPQRSSKAKCLVGRRKRLSQTQRSTQRQKVEQAPRSNKDNLSREINRTQLGKRVGPRAKDNLKCTFSFDSRFVALTMKL